MISSRSQKRRRKNDRKNGFSASCGGNAHFAVAGRLWRSAAKPTPETPTATYTPIPSTDIPTSLPPTARPTIEPPTATPTEVYTLATSADEILGMWVGSGVFYIRFDGDGTFRQAHSLEELGEPYATSAFQFEGTEFVTTEISVSGVPSCGEKVGRYKIQLLENGNIQIIEIKDQCAPRAGDTVGEYEPAK
jgi:hypothetical protein